MWKCHILRGNNKSNRLLSLYFCKSIKQYQQTLCSSQGATIQIEIILKSRLNSNFTFSCLCCLCSLLSFIYGIHNVSVYYNFCFGVEQQFLIEVQIESIVFMEFLKPYKLSELSSETKASKRSSLSIKSVFNLHFHYTMTLKSKLQLICG